MFKVLEPEKSAPMAAIVFFRQSLQRVAVAVADTVNKAKGVTVDQAAARVQQVLPTHLALAHQAKASMVETVGKGA